ncbi:CBU_0592 family membrane protein [Streptomyces sp. NBC_00483]|uniref:CBU_0592 family membrane protein n=1 Tax=Streptomyces sp. NBC_00483 TaxID=2975756 RepID=UPI003FCE01CB
MGDMQASATSAATAAGWVGALSTAAAYLLVARRVIEPDAQVFRVINMLGGALLAVSAAASGAWPSVTSNFVRVLIGVQALCRGAAQRTNGCWPCGGMSFAAPRSRTGVEPGTRSLRRAVPTAVRPAARAQPPNTASTSLS